VAAQQFRRKLHAQIHKARRNQLLMLQTVDLNSIALPGSALHSIDTIVDSLDTSTFEAACDLESSRGNCPIAPQTIIKVCLYALHSGRFSTRKMENTTRDIICDIYVSNRCPAY